MTLGVGGRVSCAIHLHEIGLNHRNESLHRDRRTDKTCKKRYLWHTKKCERRSDAQIQTHLMYLQNSLRLQESN